MSMQSLEGQLLIAMPGMGDSRFDRAVVYLCAHSDDGAMGFVINRTMDEPDVADFLKRLEIIGDGQEATLPAELQRMTLHTGGPVEPGRGFVLHSPDYTSQSTLRIADGVSLTATLDILRAIAAGKGPNQVLLALGYSGWASGQLEDEIAANGWLTSSADTELLFDPADDTKYDRALLRMGINPSLLSGEAGHA